jgi:hypothetical protein
MRRIIFAAIFSLFLWTPAVSAHEVVIDTAPAQAVMAALANPALSETEALRIAKLSANQKMIQKTASFSKGASEARFVEELVSAARGTPLQGDPLFSFGRVKKDSEGIMRTLNDLDQKRPEHIKWLNDRVTSFSPPGKPLKLNGFLIAGGGSTGFAFSGSDFYLNIAHFPDDLDAARANLAHELYHAVQGAALTALGRAQQGFNTTRYAALTNRADRDAMAVEAFLSNLLGEGTAILVGDPALLTGKGGMSTFDRTRLVTQQRRMDRLATQLDLSLISLTAEEPIDYGKAYALGFYGPDQPLYYLGYTMAKAIADKSGPQRLGQLITGTGCAFTQEYLGLVARDERLPKLGDATQRIVSRHCKA